MAISIPSIARSCHCCKTPQATPNSRQTSPGLRLSVHTDNTARHFSSGVCPKTLRPLFSSIPSFSTLGFSPFSRVHLIDHLLHLPPLFIIHPQPQLSFLRPKHHRLPLHPSHHIKRLPRLPPKRHLQHILRNPLLHHLPQFPLDLKKPIRRVQPPNPLVRPLVIVILYPVPDPLLRLLKTPKLGPYQKLLIHRLPKPLDLPQRHRMVGLRFNVLHPVFSQLPLKPRRPPPGRILPPPVRQHLLRHPVFPNRPAVYLDHLIRRLAPVQLQPHHVPRIIVDHPH